jgi:hypothetical protein
MASDEELANQKSLEMLYDYTKFHIGVYISAGTALLTASAASINNSAVFKFSRPEAIHFSIAALVLAGACGGVVLSTLTQGQCTNGSRARNTAYKSSAEFNEDEMFWLAGRQWSILEHVFFWLGVSSIFIAFSNLKYDSLNAIFTLTVFSLIILVCAMRIKKRKD